jgi:hypothetical protein
MANTYKVLGQAFPNANTNFSLYTVPAATSAIVSTLNVCNQSLLSNVTFRVAVRPAGEALASKHYIVYDTALPAQDSIALSLGMTMGNTDVLTVYSYLGNVSFNVFGTEIT